MEHWRMSWHLERNTTTQREQQLLAKHQVIRSGTRRLPIQSSNHSSSNQETKTEIGQLWKYPLNFLLHSMRADVSVMERGVYVKRLPPQMKKIKDRAITKVQGKGQSHVTTITTSPDVSVNTTSRSGELSLSNWDRAHDHDYCLETEIDIPCLVCRPPEFHVEKESFHGVA
jgi:hypothetical protein